MNLPVDSERVERGCPARQFFSGCPWSTARQAPTPAMLLCRPGGGHRCLRHLASQRSDKPWAAPPLKNSAHRQSDHDGGAYVQCSSIDRSRGDTKGQQIGHYSVVDGTPFRADGTRNGTPFYTDGTPNGTLFGPDGTPFCPDGTLFCHDGTPNGTPICQDGTRRDTNGHQNDAR